MIAIADSGSTKTDWIFISGGNELRFESIGLNPFYIDTQAAIETLSNLAANHQLNATKAVYFYGAGCSDLMHQNIIYEILKHVFSDSAVFVWHDLLGAARAVSKDRPSLVSILGTGSNSCLYDGKIIADQIDNLGFMLGDEGSGGYIGKAIVQARFYRELPMELELQFDKNYNISRDDLLHKVYHESLPNRFIASFSKFAAENIHHPFIQNLIVNCFEVFIHKHLVKYNRSDLPCHFVGSIASNFYEPLVKALEKNNLQIGNVIQKPIDGLKLYHAE